MLNKLFFPICLATLSACATSTRVSLNPEPNSCQVHSVPVNALATVAWSTCWDSDGKAIGMAGGTGTSHAEAAIGILNASSIVAGSVILGKGAVKALQAQQRIEIRDTR